MYTFRQMSLRVALFLFLSTLSWGLAEGQTIPADGWQGPRPLPQQPSAIPVPQPPHPSGKQVLEIPPQTQQPTPQQHNQLEIPTQPQQATVPAPQNQATIAPRAQPDSRRPTQFLTITVTDASGQYVPGLRPEDFQVYEEDLPQPITYFTTGKEEPVSIGFLVDTSGSMLNKIGRARQALQRFFATIRSGDEVFLQAFNHRLAMLQDFTDSRVLLDQGTTLLEPLGETALYDAIREGLQHVNQGRRQKRALVVLTDGLDTASTTSLEETVATVQRAGVMVYTIGIGNPAGGRRTSGMGLSHRPTPSRGMRFPGGHWPGMGMPSRGFPGMGQPPLPPSSGSGSGPEDTVDVNVLQTFSNESGGKHFLLDTTDVLGNQAVLDLAVQAIADELRQQYTMGYKSAFKGDVHRSIRIEPRRPGLSVRTHKSAG